MAVSGVGHVGLGLNNASSRVLSGTVVTGSGFCNAHVQCAGAGWEKTALCGRYYMHYMC